MANDLANEVRDFAVRNYKYFVYSKETGDDDTSASDGEDDVARRNRRKTAADEKRRTWLYKKAWDDFLRIFNGRSGLQAGHSDRTL